MIQVHIPENNSFHTQLLVSFYQKSFLSQTQNNFSFLSLRSWLSFPPILIRILLTPSRHQLFRLWQSRQHLFFELHVVFQEKHNFLLFFWVEHIRTSHFLESQAPPILLGINLQLLYTSVCSMLLYLTQAIAWSSFTRWHQEPHNWQYMQHCPRNRGLAAQMQWPGRRAKRFVTLLMKVNSAPAESIS